MRATTIGRRRGSIWNRVADLLDGERPGHVRDRVDLADEGIRPGREGVEGVHGLLAAVDGRLVAAALAVYGPALGGRFVFDEARRDLRSDGRRVALSPKAFELLDLLLENAPAVVTITGAWPPRSL